MLKKILLAIVVIFLLLAGWVFLFVKDVEISISEADAQQSINAYLLSPDHSTRQVQVTPQYIHIDFKSGNSAKIDSHLIVNGYGYAGQFKGVFDTSVEYRYPRLYLNHLKLIDGGFFTDEETQSELNHLKTATIDFVKRQRKRMKNSEPSTDDNKAQSTKIVEDYVIIGARIFIQSIPIYDLQTAGYKGAVASLALKDISFTEDHAIVTLSPRSAFLRILSAIGTFCFIIVWLFGSPIMSLLISRKGKTAD